MLPLIRPIINNLNGKINMRFKEYYYSNRDNKKEIFETVFEKYYNKGHFGKISKSVIKEQQESWFQKFLFILEDKDIDNLIPVLSSRDSMCTRECFSMIFSVYILLYIIDDILDIFLMFFI